MRLAEPRSGASVGDGVGGPQSGQTTGSCKYGKIHLGVTECNPAFFANRMNDAAFQISFGCRNLLHMIDMTKSCPGCNRKALDRFGVHIYHCAKHISAPIRNGFHAMLKSSVANALEAPLRTLNMRICEREPHTTDYYDPVRQPRARRRKEERGRNPSLLTSPQDTVSSGIGGPICRREKGEGL
jgi:ribosomal protein L37AE/L43A